jgi:hypothetical protein
MTSELGKSGQGIWAAFQADSLDKPAQALVRELARCADTLDRLDELSKGKREAWASLVFDDMGEVHLNVDKLLAEQRATQTVFKALYNELRQAGIKPDAGAGPKPKDEAPEDMLAAIRKRREDRERQSG